MMTLALSKVIFIFGILNILELKCTKQTLDKAKVLNDLFPNGGLREKIQFVTNCPISLDIDDLVGHYMEMVSGRRKSQAKPNN